MLTFLTKTIAAAALVVTVGLANARPAQAQLRQCASHDVIAGLLDKGWKEKLSGIGVVNAGSIVELFVSPQGTFTIIVTRTNGISCVLAAGKSWERISLPPGEAS